jgi:hypothetical protein
VEWAWVAIMVVTAPAAVIMVGVLNPLTLLMVRRDNWGGLVERVYPHRWRLAFLTFVFAFATAVFAARYG